jgi:hypothetical protein
MGGQSECIQASLSAMHRMATQAVAGEALKPE